MSVILISQKRKGKVGILSVLVRGVFGITIAAMLISCAPALPPAAPAANDAPAATCQPPASGAFVTTVNLIAQETSQWCWAASGQMIMDFFGITTDDIKQCFQANASLTRSDCCISPITADCIKPGWPEFSKHNFSSQQTSVGTALTWEQIGMEIACKGKPFAFSWQWLPKPQKGGHMMVAVGYKTVNEKDNYVYVYDPWPPDTGNFRINTYQAFVSGSGYDHLADVYDITKGD